MNGDTIMEATMSEESTGSKRIQNKLPGNFLTVQETEESLVDTRFHATEGHLVGWRLHLTTIGLVAPY